MKLGNIRKSYRSIAIVFLLGLLKKWSYINKSGQMIDLILT